MPGVHLPPAAKAKPSAPRRQNWTGAAGGDRTLRYLQVRLGTFAAQFWCFQKRKTSGCSRFRSVWQLSTKTCQGGTSCRFLYTGSISRDDSVLLHFEFGMLGEISSRVFSITAAAAAAASRTPAGEPAN